jgi:hypothetical protein
MLQLTAMPLTKPTYLSMFFFLTLQARLGNSDMLTESTLTSSVFNIELNGQTVLDIGVGLIHRC